MGLKQFLALAATLLLVASSNASAEQKKVLGSWEVHYIAFNTTFLTPEVASNYQIKRSPNNALINISVLDRRSGEAQNVSISGTAKNLLGNSRELTFKQVTEGDAIYYLASLPFDDQEHYRFNLSIQQGNVNQQLKFEQKLYREE